MSDQSSGPATPFRTLLPAPKQSGHDRGPEFPQRHFDFKKRRQAAACEPCREHKTKCDGSRPTCSTCLRRGSDCRFEAEPKETHVQALRRKYETLQEKRSAQQQVCELLRTRPEAEALSIFRRLREGDSPEVVMRHVQHGDLLLQLSLRSESEQQSETSSSEPPSGQGHGVLVSAGDAEHPHRGTLLYGATSALSSVVPSPATANARDQTATGALRDGLGLKTLPFSRQNVECDVVEPLIDKVRPCRWTSVVAEDEVMRSLLNLFFQLEYRWFHVPVFHKDSFLRDMASEIPENCSSLLVNAVLACACNAPDDLKDRYRFSDPGGKLGHSFFTEAVQQWDSEQNRGNQRLTTVQAGFLLNILLGMDGPESSGWRYTTRSIHMARDLGLFDAQSYRSSDPEVQRAQHARLYTAWSAFCWQSLWCYHFSSPPLIKHPPAVASPDPTDHPEWYGELRVRHPNSEEILPVDHGRLLKAKTHLLVTLHQHTDSLFWPRSGPSAEVPSGLQHPPDHMDCGE